jgi:microcystin degradation protein MlrC
MAADSVPNAENTRDSGSDVGPITSHSGNPARPGAAIEADKQPLGQRDMKIFVSGIYQETNSFCPVRTEIGLFRREKLTEGDDIAVVTGGANLEIAGFFDELPRRFPGATVVPGIFAWGIAAGPLRDETFADLTGRLLTRLKKVLPVDAVVLSLHGSMAADSCDDCEGELLARIRKLVGRKPSIAVSLDFHAVITGKMVRNADLLLGYRTYPHVDMAETGRRTVAALAALVQSGRKFSPLFRRWPSILPVDNTQTDSGPMAELMGNLALWEKVPGVLTASVFCPHPWIDVREHGVTLMVYVANGSMTGMEQRMEEALRRVWARRGEFVTTCLKPDAFFSSVRLRARPVAAIDAGDVTTAGAVGDSTVILQAALVQNDCHTLVPLVDPDTVAEAWAAGNRARRLFYLGGSSEPGAYNTRLPLSAEVIRLTDQAVRFNGPAFGGMTFDFGRRALLDAGSVKILAVRHSSWLHDPEIWRSVGIEPADADVIVQKSHKLFRPAYANIVRRVETVDTPGCTDRQLTRFPFRHLPRPIFPLDDSDTFCCETKI